MTQKHNYLIGREGIKYSIEEITEDKLLVMNQYLE